MADLTTPDKRRNKHCSPSLNTGTEGNVLDELSPFLPPTSAFYMSFSPFQPVHISYCSPMPNPVKKNRIEDLLIDMCENVNCHILKKSSALEHSLEAAFEPKKEINKLKSSPPVATEGEPTCEGSDLKPPQDKIKACNIQNLEERKPFDRSLNLNAKIQLMKHAKMKQLTAEERIIRRRKRKSMEQLKQLSEEYKKNPNWNKDIMAKVARKLGLSEAQVYKWGWDQKKKKFEDEQSKI